MTFTIIFLIVYGLCLGVCQLATFMFSGTDAKLVKNMSYVPILNVVSAVLIIFFMFFLVRDYRKNKNKPKENK